jgi:Fur family ferric uptake transcriptional regulator
LLPCGRPAPEVDKAKSNKKDARELLQKITENLDQFVAQKNLNRSEVRNKILETIVYEARHFRAPDLLEHLHRRYPDVGKATLYRNLPVLVESGVLQEGPTDSDGQVYYELTEDEHHDHIVCMDCHKIFEYQDDLIEKRQEELAAGMNFHLKNHRHVIYATCQYKNKN